jgi:hypothetical protein
LPNLLIELKVGLVTDVLTCTEGLRSIDVFGETKRDVLSSAPHRCIIMYGSGDRDGLSAYAQGRKRRARRRPSATVPSFNYWSPGASPFSIGVFIGSYWFLGFRKPEIWKPGYLVPRDIYYKSIAVVLLCWDTGWRYKVPAFLLGSPTFKFSPNSVYIFLAAYSKFPEVSVDCALRRFPGNLT